jgi:hypothetical protein
MPALFGAHATAGRLHNAPSLPAIVAATLAALTLAGLVITRLVSCLNRCSERQQAASPNITCELPRSPRHVTRHAVGLRPPRRLWVVLALALYCGGWKMSFAGAQNFDCTGKSECKGNDRTCTSSPCTVTCDGARACEDMTLKTSDAVPVVTVTCKGEGACGSLVVTGSSPTVTVTCGDNSGVCAGGSFSPTGGVGSLWQVRCAATNCNGFSAGIGDLQKVRSFAYNNRPMNRERPEELPDA